MGYQEGGVSKGLLRRYERHLSNTDQEALQTQGAPQGTEQTTIPPTNLPANTAPVTGVTNNATQDAGYVTTKHGATVFQANPHKGLMSTDKMHMKRTIQQDRKQGWNNFISGLGFQKKQISSF